MVLNNIKYKNPALVEAVFELRFPSKNEWGMSSFIKFANAANKQGYTELIDAAPGYQVNFSTTDQSPQVKQVSRRIQTWNKEKNQLWQASPELFAANRRAPYLGWEKFRPHIFQGFELYSRIAQPKKAELLVMTYVNQIEFSDTQKASDFLVFIPPEVSYADQINNIGCFTEQVFKDGDEISITAGRDLSIKKNIAINLNIGYTIKLPSLDKNRLKEITEKAHQRIVDAFEKSITDLQKERMEGI